MCNCEEFQPSNLSASKVIFPHYKNIALALSKVDSQLTCLIQRVIKERKSKPPPQIHPRMPVTSVNSMCLCLTYTVCPIVHLLLVCPANVSTVLWWLTKHLKLNNVFPGVLIMLTTSVFTLVKIPSPWTASRSQPFWLVTLSNQTKLTYDPLVKDCIFLWAMSYFYLLQLLFWKSFIGLKR